MNIPWLAYVLIEVVGLALAAEAVYKSRTAQGSIAWAFSLVTLPFIAIPIYLLFAGRRFHGYVRLRKQGDLKIDKSIAKYFAQLQPFATLGSHPFAVLEKMGGLPMVGANHVHLLIDGDATFKHLFNAIKQAEKYVLVQYYIVRNDRLGRAFQNLLINKAQEGVKIYFQFDALGSIDLNNSFVQAMEQAGIQVSRFVSTKQWSKRWQINFRNHRKLVIVDGQQAFVGGLNVGDEYMGEHMHMPPWRDTHVAIQGVAVHCAQMVFLEDWHWATGIDLTLDWPLPKAIPKKSQQVLILATGPADRLDACEMSFLYLFGHAQKRLWLVSPYFVPDMSVMHSLQLAALRGVDVRLLVPRKADNWLVQLSGYSFLEEALLVGIHVYRYEAGFLHQKVLLIDDETSLIGTANLDNRSLHLNFEIGALVYDKDFAGEVETMLQKDFSLSRRLHLAELQKRNLLLRFLSKLARLMAPLQ
jgi:cardiolipin synthase